MAKKIYNFVIFKEDGKYIARCVEFLITEAADTEEEAIKKTIESMKFHNKEYGLYEYKYENFPFKNYQNYKIKKIEVDL